MKRERGIHRLGNVGQIMKLPDGRHHDGGQLYVQVRGSSRSWLFRLSPKPEYGPHQGRMDGGRLIRYRHPGRGPRVG